MESPTFIPLCTVDLELVSATVIEDGPAGTRLIAPISAMRLTGERLSGELDGPCAADWMTISGGVATVDVRATIRTDDDAIVFVQYRGRSDAAGGVGSAPFHVAVTFETSAERYLWLNPLVAVGRGELAEMRYEWFEVR